MTRMCIVGKRKNFEKISSTNKETGAEKSQIKETRIYVGNKAYSAEELDGANFNSREVNSAPATPTLTNVGRECFVKNIKKTEENKLRNLREKSKNIEV